MATYLEYRQAVIDTAPWIYWPLGEGSGGTAQDYSGNGRNGAEPVAGNTAWGYQTSGGFGPRYAIVTGGLVGPTFTGTVPLLSGAFSVMGIYRPPALANYGPGIGSSAGWTGFVGHSSSTGQGYFGTNISSRFSPTGFFAANTWTHWIFTQETNGSSILYRNGVQNGATTTLTRPTVNPSDWYIFSNSTGVAHIQHMAVWNRVLTPAEALALGSASVTWTETLLAGSISQSFLTSGDETNISRSVLASSSLSQPFTTSGVLNPKESSVDFIGGASLRALGTILAAAASMYGTSDGKTTTTARLDVDMQGTSAGTSGVAPLTLFNAIEPFTASPHGVSSTTGLMGNNFYPFGSPSGHSSASGILSYPRAIFPTDTGLPVSGLTHHANDLSDIDYATTGPDLLTRFFTNDVTLSTFPCVAGVQELVGSSAGTSGATASFNDSIVSLDAASHGTSSTYLYSIELIVGLASISQAWGTSSVTPPVMRVTHTLEGASGGTSGAGATTLTPTWFLNAGSPSGSSSVSATILRSNLRSSVGGGSQVGGRLVVPSLRASIAGGTQIAASLPTAFLLRGSIAGSAHLNALFGKVRVLAGTAITGVGAVANADLGRHMLPPTPIRGISSLSARLEYIGSQRFRADLTATSSVTARLREAVALRTAGPVGTSSMIGHERIYPEDFDTRPIVAGSSVSSPLIGKLRGFVARPVGSSSIAPVKIKTHWAFHANPVGGTWISAKLRYGVGGDILGSSEVSGITAVPLRGTGIGGGSSVAASLLWAHWSGTPAIGVSSVGTYQNWGAPLYWAYGVKMRMIMPHFGTGTAIGVTVFPSVDLETYARGDLRWARPAGSSVASGALDITRAAYAEMYLYATVQKALSRQMAGWITFINDPDPPIVNPPGTEVDDDVEPVVKQEVHFV